jgi:2-keto-4-pentenoate hydratase
MQCQTKINHHTYTPMQADSGRPESPIGDPEVRAIASRFVAARLESRPLAGFPGEVPADLATAYRCQDAAIELWPDAIGGWKVGRIPPAVEAGFRSDRLAGPIFRASILHTGSDDLLEMPVYAGGFAAIEAEFVIVVGRDAPDGKVDWSLEEAAGMIGELRIGVEMASSPLSTINELGPAAIASDFGNNAGLIVGPEIRDWRLRALDTMSCEAFVEDRSVGHGGAFNLSGGPVRSMQFILELAARRGRPLKAGMTIATGQTTGIHDILPGQTARVDFGADGRISCKAVAAAARTTST